jgi:hypothetical protein
MARHSFYSARMIQSPPSRTARLGVVLAGDADGSTVAARSRTALDRTLRCPAELSVAVVRDDAVLLGAFQRLAGLAIAPGTQIARRGSGGPEVRVGPGTVHVALSMENPASLVPCDEKRIVNRHVRPLLRALTRTGAGAIAHFFGRDWISVAHRPVAWVGFAHDATTRRTLFEAFVAVRTPFALTERGSFLGHPQGTLESVAGATVDEARLVQAIADAYAREADAVTLERLDITPPEEGATTPEEDRARLDPPWAAVVDEVIGPLGAGPDVRGVFRVGGDLLVSRDALAALETRAATAGEDDLGRLVDQTLAAPGVALDGVRSLQSIRDVIAAARRRG